MRRMFWIVGWMMGVYAGGAAAGADEDFKALYEREWRWRLQQSPQFATGVGVHDYDDRLGRVDIRSQKARLAWLQRFRGELAALDADALSPEAQVNHAIYVEQIDNAIASIKLGAYLMPMTSD